MEDNKHLDETLKNMLQEIPMESPSSDFTRNVMGTVLQQRSKIFVYRPLITKKVWFAAAAILVLIFFVPFKKQEGGLLEKMTFDLSFLNKVQFPTLSLDLGLSNTVMYAALLFSVMMFIQIVYLKGYFERRIG